MSHHGDSPAEAQGRAGTSTAFSSLPDSPDPCLVLHPSAPKRPPGNISWSFSGSTVSIRWDPVVAKADESAVTGYKVWPPSPGGDPKKAQGTGAQHSFFPQMLYRQDSHSAPTLYLASKSHIDIPIPEDFTHAFVQIRVTGPGGDGTPAEVHILRNSGT